MAVRKGYKANWKYVGRWYERKIRPGVWKFAFVATKKRRAKSYGSIKRNDEINWTFGKVRQRVRKVGKGRYQTRLTGYKYFKRGKFK